MDVSAVADLVDFAGRLRKYRLNLSYAYSFFAYGCAISSVILLVLALGFEKFPLAFGIAVVVAIIPCVLLISTIFKDAYSFETSRLAHEGMYWMISFALPFAILYSFGFLFVAYIESWYHNAWYPALGISLLLVSVLIENKYVKDKLLLGRPFLLTSTCIIITSPLPFIVSGITYYGNLMGIGLMLLLYFVAASYMLIKSNKAFESD